MSRLYYDSAKAPVFRGATTKEAAIPPANQAPSPSSAKEYLEKVSRIIPSEIIAGYLSLVGLVPLVQNEVLRPKLYYGSFFLGAILTPVYLYYQADKSRPNAIHIILSSVSFIVWAYSVTGDKIAHNFFDPAIASIVLVVFSLISGKVPLK